MSKFIKSLLVAFACCLLAVGVVALFGDSIRSLLGSSADALAGDPGPRAVERRAMKNFGESGAFDSLGGYAPLPPTVVASGNSFAPHRANRFTCAADDRFSTFAVDVDTASYVLGRTYLRSGVLPPPTSVRVEEYLNYFRYAYPAPDRGVFAVHFEGAPSPFNRGRELVRIALKGRELTKAQRKPAHLVFLVDVSGSMAGENKLDLARSALGILVDNLHEWDTVAIVTYAGEVRRVLAATSAANRADILAAIASLRADGSTAMGSGLELAYREALLHVSPESVSRVIVLTDGDANAGDHQTADQMLAAVHGHVAEGVTLTAIGFGMGNYRDDLMEKLADRGNGNCFYLDSLTEARKVFQEQLSGTLEVIAKDVKLQVEWNPEAVRGFRLLGYEDRALTTSEFRDDRVDAGEVGAGHSVTALYEIERTGEAVAELATVRVRAKLPNGSKAQEGQFKLEPRHLHARLSETSAGFRFSVAVAGAADIFRRSIEGSDWNLSTALELARGATEERADREEFVGLLDKALELRRSGSAMAQGY
ncbi:MAG: vWA domain-containing protein [Myxococcaceae bacterium]